MRNKLTYSRSKSKMGDMEIETLAVLDTDGNVVAEYICDHRFEAYKHWVRMFRDGLISSKTFDIIIAADNLRGFFNVRDLYLKPNCEERLRETLAFEERMYSMIENKRYSEMMKTEIGLSL